MEASIMTAIQAEKPLVAVSALPGVKDLALNVRGYFAKALIAEANGDHEGAEVALNKAIENEAKAVA